MQWVIAFAALTGFGLGLRIGLFGLLSLTALAAALLAAAAASGQTEVQIWQVIGAVAAFQLAAFGGMIARHSGSEPRGTSEGVATSHFGLVPQRVRSSRGR